MEMLDKVERDRIRRNLSFSNPTENEKKKISKPALPLMNTPENEIEQEYLNMMKITQDSSKLEVASDPKNHHKNRYSNVLPIENTRVKLKKSDPLDSDYINANYIVGNKTSCKSEQAQQQYICCQAPLKTTFDDFWLMVLQHKCPVIVMLTRLKERSNVVKADQYWPNELGETKRYGSVNVTYKKYKPHGTGIIVRKFTLQSIEEDSEPFEVVHMHYMEWPDFGVPESTEVMASLIRELDIRKKGLEDPIVVHCSAGIGRTGTFLAIHMNLQKLSSTGGTDIDVMKTVLDLRQQRHGMIQSEEQYKFVYATIKDMMKDKFTDNSRYAQHMNKNQHLFSSTQALKLPSQESGFLINKYENEKDFQEEDDDDEVGFEIEESSSDHGESLIFEEGIFIFKKFKLVYPTILFESDIQ